MSDNEFHVGRCDLHLLEAILHATEAVGDVGKTPAIENSFLHTGDEAKLEVFAHFTDFAKETEVEDERLIASTTEIIEKLIHHEQQSKIREFLVKDRHHLLEGCLVLPDLLDARKTKGDAPLVEFLLEMRGDDLAQRHFGRPDLDADHLELAGNLRSRYSNALVRKQRLKFGILGDTRNHGQKMRLAGA